MAKIFKQFSGMFKNANWNKISSPTIEGQGVFHELIVGTGIGFDFIDGAEYFKRMWDAGIKDKQDEFIDKELKSDKKIDGKRL